MLEEPLTQSESGSRATHKGLGEQRDEQGLVKSSDYRVAIHLNTGALVTVFYVDTATSHGLCFLVLNGARSSREPKVLPKDYHESVTTRRAILCRWRSGKWHQVDLLNHRYPNLCRRSTELDS